MPAWTLGDLMSSTTAALGNRADLALSDVSFWVNESQRHVWDELPHDLQEGIAVSSTTSGEDKITLPTDFQELLVLSNLSGSPAPVLLDPINLDDMDSWSTQLGIPTHYAQYSDWLELRPSPDSSYSMQLRYRKALSDMTETTDAPSVATRYRYAVFLKSKELVAQNLVRSVEDAALARNEYLQYMSAMPSDRALRQRENRFFQTSIPRKRGDTPGTTTLPFDKSDT